MRLDLPFGPALNLPTSPADPHLWVGLVGLALALAGSRLYRLAIVGPGVAVGAMAGLELAGAVGFESRMVAAAVLGVLGGLLAHFLERLAIALGGALLCGGLANLVGAMFWTGELPWFIPAAGAVIGLLAFPSVYKRLLPLVTALMGALCTAWALGRPDDLRVVGFIAVLGLIVQSVGGGDKSKKKAKAD